MSARSWLGESVAWYDAHAERFAQAADACDPAAARALFLQAVRCEGPLLDLGCGSGRDLKAFAQTGRTCEGWEPSPQLATIAARQSGQPVHVRSIDDLPNTPTWAGIWMMGVLLHTPKESWSATLARVASCLLPGGGAYICVKDGDMSGVDGQGRPFAAANEAALLTIVANAPGASWTIGRDLAKDSSGKDTLWWQIIGKT